MQVFVPSYSGSKMVMLKIKDMNDFESLPLTKWNIRQPNCDGNREDACETGKCILWRFQMNLTFLMGRFFVGFYFRWIGFDSNARRCIQS